MLDSKAWVFNSMKMSLIILSAHEQLNLYYKMYWITNCIDYFIKLGAMFPRNSFLSGAGLEFTCDLEKEGRDESKIVQNYSQMPSLVVALCVPGGFQLSFPPLHCTLLSFANWRLHWPRDNPADPQRQKLPEISLLAPHLYPTLAAGQTFFCNQMVSDQQFTKL